MQYAFGVQVYGEVLYLEFTQFSQNSLITMKYCSCENGIYDKGVGDFNNYMENKYISLFPCLCVSNI